MSATAPQFQDEAKAIVELLCSSGLHGQDQQLLHAAREQATRIIAIRQLEALGGQLACVWLDDEEDSVEFGQSTFIPRMMAFTNIVKEADAVQQDENEEMCKAWTAVQNALEWALSNEPPKEIWGAMIASLFVSTMILRQCAELELNRAAPRQEFRTTSSNVAPGFLGRCTDRLGWQPFGAMDGAPLEDLLRRIPAEFSRLISSEPGELQRRTA